MWRKTGTTYVWPPLAPGTIISFEEKAHDLDEHRQRAFGPGTPGLRLAAQQPQSKLEMPPDDTR
jgi:hypothetical protein